MNRSYRIEASNEADCLQALIPNRCIWDLVEYLALQGVRATYGYSADIFVVKFPHMERDAAQELLEEWAGRYVGPYERDPMLEEMESSNNVPANA
jgi:hypothetical protein